MNASEQLGLLRRPFPPDEIKWRAMDYNRATTKPLLYLTARIVMDRLDEVVGTDNWCDSYQDHTTHVVCNLSVRFSGQDSFVTKADVGTGGNFEPEKSMYSDSLKRAAVKFGVGRYLYEGGIIEERLPFSKEENDFKPDAVEKIRQAVDTHYRLFASDPRETGLSALFRSAATTDQLESFRTHNKPLVEELKAADSGAHERVKGIYVTRMTQLKEMEG